MYKNGLISVIVPVYNVEDYLAKCIDSILIQTYSNLEIILVDDGATDRCPEICDEYSIKDSRIKVIHKKNGGLSSARNAGIDVATGEFLCFVDSDDYLDISMVENLLNDARRYDADISCINCYEEIDSELCLPRFYIKKDVVTSDKTEIFNLMFCAEEGHIYGTAWGKLYKHSLFEDVRFQLNKIHEDTYLFADLLKKRLCVSFSSKFGYIYLIRKSGIMRSASNVKHMEDVLAYCKMINEMVNADKSFYTLATTWLRRTYVNYRKLICKRKLEPEQIEYMNMADETFSKCYRTYYKKHRVRDFFLLNYPDFILSMYVRLHKDSQ